MFIKIQLDFAVINCKSWRVCTSLWQENYRFKLCKPHKARLLTNESTPIPIVIFADENKSNTMRTPRSLNSWKQRVFVQHCMNLQLAVDPYMLFESMHWLPKTQSYLKYFCKSNINQIFTNGSGMIWGVRIAIFTEIRHLVEELITFLSIFGPQKRNMDCENQRNLMLKNWSHFVLFRPFPGGLKSFQILRSSM